jgi:hypothetical protein
MWPGEVQILEFLGEEGDDRINEHDVRVAGGGGERLNQRT